jgi:hypothetical protein
MKNTFLFAFFVSCSILFTSCPLPPIQPPATSCSDKGYVAVWNGTDNTDWHKSPRNELYICTAEELAGFAKLVNSGNKFGSTTVKLGASIMLNDTANWQNWANESPKNKWVPIGDSLNSFTGTFDGNGFAISGVYINSTNGYQGLFGYVKNIIGSSKTIKNLGVNASYIKGGKFVGGIAGLSEGKIINSYSGAVVEGSYYVGGLVGRNYGGTVSSSHSASIVTGKENVGGLVGNSEGMMGLSASNVSDCYSTGTIKGERRVGGLIGMNALSYVSNSYSASIVEGKGLAGGLIGYNLQSNVSKSHSAGKVIGDSVIGGFVGDNLNAIINNSYSSSEVKGIDHVGGFAGRNYVGGTISNNYSIGEAKGDSLVGGLVGFNWGNINNSYSNSTVKGRTWVGGFAGLSIGTISNSYSAGIVTGTENHIGGFAGVNDNDKISKSYYDKEASGQNSGLGAGNGEIEGKTTAEMKEKKVFVDWDFDKIWDINGGYPYLRENP